MTLNCRRRLAVRSGSSSRNRFSSITWREARCLPDFLVTVTRPGEPDDQHPGVSYTASHKVRYIIEVMGFDTPEYEDRKKVTHSTNAQDRPRVPFGSTAVRFPLLQPGTSVREDYQANPDRPPEAVGPG